MFFIPKISATTNLLCVIGHPVKHSMSPIMHNAVIQDLNLDYIYLAFDVCPNKLREAAKGFKALEIKGINVTIPHKQHIIEYIDKIGHLAKKIGAINTIKNDEGILKAKNTDAIGGMKALKDAGCKISGMNVLFLGSGGAARALVYALAEEVNKIVIANRTIERAVKLANEVRESLAIQIKGKGFNKEILKKEVEKADILINTTPIGMYPDINNSPIPKDFLHGDLFVFDVIYNPLETQLIKFATQKGCQTLGGLDMLVNQGALAFEWWTNKKPNIELMKNQVIEFLGENVVR